MADRHHAGDCREGYKSFQKLSMEHKQKLATVRQRIIEANPEIAELKPFQSRVKIGEKIRTVLAVTNDKIILVDRYGQTSWHPGEYEIIGRDIWLHDVLIAIGIFNPDLLIAERLNERVTMRKQFVELLTEWKFALPLSEQREEVIAFLYDITNK